MWKKDKTYFVRLLGELWRRKWQPTPVFLPGKSHGQRSLVGYSPWGCKELDTIERLHSLHTLSLEKAMATPALPTPNSPPPVFLPGESHRQRSLVGHGPWESDTTEVAGHWGSSVRPRRWETQRNKFHISNLKIEFSPCQSWTATEWEVMTCLSLAVFRPRLDTI